MLAERAALHGTDGWLSPRSLGGELQREMQLHPRDRTSPCEAAQQLRVSLDAVEALDAAELAAAGREAVYNVADSQSLC